MRITLLILLVLAMGATAYVLVRGVMLMASGKDVTGESLITRRELLQAAMQPSLPRLRFSASLIGDPEALLKEVRETYGSAPHVRIVLRREDDTLDAVYPRLADTKP